MPDDALAAFERFKAEVLSNSPTLSADLYADDIVVEWPFARPGSPDRIEGLAAFRELAETGRRQLALRFDGFHDEVVHRSADPARIVVEYRLSATSPQTGSSASMPFITALGVDSAGRINHWREYQDTAGMKEALAAVGIG